jgi:transposase InsO family protein
MRITEEVKNKVIELDRRYRSSWDVRSLAHVAGISHTTVAKIVKEIRGERPKPVQQPHIRRTRFMFRDVMWSTDFVELPGKRWLIKTLDEMSRFRLGWNVVKAQTAEAVEQHASDILERMGRAPLVWKFDHGSQFTGELFQSVLEADDIVPYPTPPRAPWANGRVKRDHQEIQNWLIPLEGKNLTTEQLEKEVDEGMFMLNFIKPRMVLDYKKSAEVYFHAEGVEQVNRAWLALDIESQKCLLGPNGGERLHRRAVRNALQSWGLYQEWQDGEYGSQTVNTSQ